MAHLKARGNIIWVKHYDKLSGTRIEYSTHIKTTRDGWIEAKKLLKQIESNNDIGLKYIEKDSKLSLDEGKFEYISLRRLKSSTIELYETSVRVIKECCGDKAISAYSKNDYKKLLLYFDKKKYSKNTQGIYTAHLHALFEYFKSSGYLKENVITIVKKDTKVPEKIDDSDLKVILHTLYSKGNKDQYYLIMFLLITGFRISSALALKWESIDFVNGFVVAPNVKKDREFFFPLTDDLKSLLTEMGVKKNGNVFNYSEDGLKFFNRVQQSLLTDKDGAKITKRYTMHQLRKTFITKLLEQGIPIHIVKSLADHSNVSTTMKYYAAVNVQKMKEVINESRIFGDILGDNKRLKE